jgi:hypothetical protein
VSLFHKRHRKFEAFDRVEMAVAPRLKSSGLSGDEWRSSVSIKFFFKGVVVHETQTRDMETAILLLGGEFVRNQEPIPTKVIEVERDRCDQPGCGAKADVKLKIKRLTSERGEWLDDKEQSLQYYRRFCAHHSDRGDCDREDCTDNYETIAEAAS